MKKQSPFVIIFLILFSTSIKSQTLERTNKSDSSILDLSLVEAYELKESKYILPRVRLASSESMDKLVIYSKEDPGLIYYFGNGEFQEKIGSIGRGPFEYQSLNMIKLIGDSLFVWDANKLKLMIYKLNGENVKEIGGFRWAVKKFAVVGDDVFFYNSGNSSSPTYIERYSLKENKYKEKYGLRTEEDILLGVNAESGGLVQRDGYVYFVSPGSLSINRVDVKDSTEDRFEIIDDNFKVPKIKSAGQIIGSGIEGLNKALNSSSFVRNVFALENYLVIFAQNGDGVFNSQYGAYTVENQKIRFYVIDYDTMEMVDTFTFSIAANRRIQDTLWSSTRNELMLVSSYDFESDQHIADTENPYKVHFFSISAAGQ